MELSHVMRVGALCTVGTLVGVLALRLVTRSIHFKGLLAAPGYTGVSAERLQLLAVTILVAFRYGMEVISAKGTGMPALGQRWLTIFATSCAIYLTIKAIRIFSLNRDQARESQR
jgi:hypothetical protein